MVRKVTENFVPISFLAALLVVSSSSSSPIQNDLLEELKVELKSLRLKVDLLEARNVKNEAKIIKLEEKVDAQLQSDRLASASFSDQGALHSANQKEMNPTDIKEKFRLDSHEISDTSLGTLNELDDLTDNYDRVHLIKGKRSSNADEHSPRAIAPSSCRDLSLIGHSLDGLYLVQNVETNKIETVLCKFGTSISQQLIGDVDVKSKTVHFYVTRNTSFSSASSEGFSTRFLKVHPLRNL